MRLFFAQLLGRAHFKQDTKAVKNAKGKQETGRRVTKDSREGYTHRAATLVRQLALPTIASLFLTAFRPCSVSSIFFIRLIIYLMKLQGQAVSVCHLGFCPAPHSLQPQTVFSRYGFFSYFALFRPTADF
ncbi:hypothetical protein DDV21_001985 [Streptococcus chenjunshii]|uniref:Uncharacterized protein n=1 Tax=Streptococcus chenjunshii TaxID=2173853 RepID=A0A372KNQ1_9STRE|nr:hypothetical protein DDV21_001985 [Streptococcus chenjunshii]RFU51833.1 hypothetical protein DDV22_01790 [Streptococcus chenjunshii]RFU53921.1 hypothetical protein DDV23_02290 [Streptococcus chenjunshii]